MTANRRDGYEAEGVVSSSPTSNAVALVELLPCPFCGGEGAYSAQGFVFCRACGCEGAEAPVEGEPGMARRDAIAAWNTRDQSQAARIAELVGFAASVAHGYQVNHTSKWCRDQARSLLSEEA